MFQPKHMPNKLELMLVVAVCVIALILTGIIFPLIISTDKLPLAAIVILFFVILFLMIIGIQAVFNFLYLTWQRKTKKKKSKK